MTKQSNTIKRARRISLRMARIMKAVQATDTLLDMYFDTRATEIENFNAELEMATKIVDFETVREEKTGQKPRKGRKAA